MVRKIVGGGPSVAAFRTMMRLHVRLTHERYHARQGVTVTKM
jgi:hypothetical protein